MPGSLPASSGLCFPPITALPTLPLASIPEPVPSRSLRTCPSPPAFPGNAGHCHRVHFPCGPRLLPSSVCPSLPGQLQGVCLQLTCSSPLDKVGAVWGRGERQTCWILLVGLQESKGLLLVQTSGTCRFIFPNELPHILSWQKGKGHSQPWVPTLYF